MSRWSFHLASVLFAVCLIFACGDDCASPENANGETMDVAGPWIGTWQSTAYDRSGRFALAMTQQGSNLSGTIDIPDIGFVNAPLSGTITGNQFTFGDVDNQITFIGTVTTDTLSASGTYAYPGQSDQGTWSAEKGTGSFISLVDSLDLPGAFFGSDLTWDGSNLWLLGPNDNLWRVDPVSGAIDSTPTPGSHPVGIAYDGVDLMVGDNWWGTEKIYRVDAEEPGILMGPGSSKITGLAHDGAFLWCLEDHPSAPRVYQVRESGDVMSSFACASAPVKGLAYDGVSLWYGAFDMGILRIYQVDVSGAVLSSFEAPGFMPGGLAYDGGSLWHVNESDDVIQELSTSGQLISSFVIAFDAPQGLAWDGSNLWLATGDISTETPLIHQLDRSGTVISSIECPGNDPGGLASDGTDLWHVDGQTKRIYRLQTSGESYLALPSFEFQYLAHDGSSLWAEDHEQHRLCGFDAEGEIQTSFPYPWEDVAYPSPDVSGIVWIGASLWAARKDWMMLEGLYKLDAEGKIIASYLPFGKLPEPFGLTYDGTNLWYLGRECFGVAFKLYKVGEL